MSQDTTQLAPGLAQTEAEVRAGLSSSAAMSAARQREAEAFQRENGAVASAGAQVLAGQKGG